MGVVSVLLPLLLLDRDGKPIIDLRIGRSGDEPIAREDIVSASMSMIYPRADSSARDGEGGRASMIMMISRSGRQRHRRRPVRQFGGVGQSGV